jgi:Ca-activated chloride channel homolog
MGLETPGSKTTANRRKRGIVALTLACMAAGYTGYFFLIAHGSMMDLWLTPDQQGRYYFERHNYRTASERFQNPLWRGIACYQDGNFGAAVAQFARIETPEGYYDLGNAYAHSGKLEQAAASYEEALRRKPDYREARENLDIVQSLIQKQKGKKKEDEAPQEHDPTYTADQVKFDEKGKKGSKGEVAQSELTTEQIQDLWMRGLQTTPADFLRMKFAVQIEESKNQKARGKPAGGM